MQPSKLLTRRELTTKNAEAVAHQKDGIEARVSRNIAELLIANSAGDDGDAIIAQLLVNLHDGNSRVVGQRVGKGTVPPYPASYIDCGMTYLSRSANLKKGKV